MPRLGETGQTLWVERVVKVGVFKPLLEESIPGGKMIGPELAEVKALCHGCVAVHRNPFKPSMWSVVSRTTGLTICWTDTQQKALEVGQWLIEEYPRALEQNTKKKILRQFPVRLAEWLRGRNRSGQCVTLEQLRQVNG